MTPTRARRARRLAGWLSVATLAGYWLALTLESELDTALDELEELRSHAAVLELELATARAAEDDT